MKTMKTIFSGRILAAVLALVLLTLGLVSCGGQAAPTLSYNVEVLSDGYNKTDDKGQKTEYAIEYSDAKRILALLSATYSAEFDTQEILIAAKRGYDITAGGGNDSGRAYPQLALNTEAVYALIKKANESKNEFTNDEMEALKEKFIPTVSETKADGTKKTDAEIKAETELKKAAAVAALTPDVNLWISSMAVDVVAKAPDLWGSIMIGIGAVLNWITNVLGFKNYVLGICVFAVLIEILMIPFAIKQQKNSIKQAKLRPKEMAIKNKYKGRTDQPTMQKMQAEIQELYQRENFSPASGCLPLLIQLPIIMILYSIVMDPLHYVLGQDASFTAVLNNFASTSLAAGGLGIPVDASRGSIELLSRLGSESGVMEALGNFEFYNFGDGVLSSIETALNNVPNFNIGPINFGMTPGFDGWEKLVLLSVPVVTFVTYFVSSKLNRKLMYQSAMNDNSNPQVACSNNMMDIMMPAMSTFFTLAVPALIGVYWAFRSWLGLLKTFIVARAMPLPVFTEEDYKAAAKEMAGKKTVTKSASAGAVRSLHYIDDEDFEDTRERGLARRAAIEEREREEQQSREKNAKMGAAPMKEERMTREKKPSEKKEQKRADEEKRGESDDNNKDEV